MSADALEVLATGPLALLQDLGRPGRAHLGVSLSGAADRAGAAAANRLVGNRPGAACVEVVFGGLRVRARQTLLMALTGAVSTALVESGNRVIAHPAGTSFTVLPGDTLTLTAPVAGLRSYLAIRGGFEAERILGSRSTDVLSGLGPAPLQVGDILRLADEYSRSLGDWPAATLIPPPPHRTTEPELLTIARGPRDDWFGDAGWRRLLDATWTVGTDSNRVGVRFAAADGSAIGRAAGYDRELPSEGMVPGAVQIPPSGEPIVFLRDHPVTGGYPVIGVLTEPAIDRAAQLRPGDTVRFTG